jgi:hypothetical protein
MKVSPAVHGAIGGGHCRNNMDLDSGYTKVLFVCLECINTICDGGHAVDKFKMILQGEANVKNHRYKCAVI